MNPYRGTAVTTGVLFIVATAANLVATGLERPVLSRSDYLSAAMSNANPLSAAGLLELIAAGTSVGIAIVLYPLLRRWSAALALGSVVFRTVEASMYTAGAVGLLAILAMAPKYASAAAADRFQLQTAGDLLLNVRQESILSGVFAFATGALMYYAIFYRARLVPRWLSGWGIFGVLLLLAACLSALLGGSPVTSNAVLVIPIAVQEMVLAIWLIAKGFTVPVVQSQPNAAAA